MSTSGKPSDVISLELLNVGKGGHQTGPGISIIAAF